MEINIITFDDFVKLAKVLWLKSYNSIKQTMLNSGLVRKVDIPANSGNTREFSSVDTEEYLAYKGESDQVTRGRIQQGYTNTATAKRVGLNVGISYEMRHYNKYPEVVRRLTAAGKQGPNRIDLDLSHRFTFGTSTSYVDKDGRTIDITTGASSTQQLFDTNHPLAGSTTTYRNRLANNPRLSQGALEGMQRLVTEETYNALGEKVTANFDILWTTDDPNTVNTALQYLKSTANPEGAHSGVFNPYKGQLRHVILPRVATDCNGARDTNKRYYWGLASSEMTSLCCGIWEAPHLIPPAANTSAEDAQTDDWEFRNRAGYGITTVEGMWVKFSSGNSES